MRKLFAMVIPAAASVLLTISGAGVALAEAPRTQCDVEASHTADIAPLAPPVEWEKLDGYRALGACLQALEQYPDSGRIMALTARAYSKLQDNDNTFKWARRAAETGSNLGIYQLALAYDYGEGVTRDPEVTVLYMRRVAQAGYPAAVHNLGIYHRKGAGVPKNVDEAIAHFERAASMNYPRSYLVLGEIWEAGEKGSRTKEDLRRARDYFAKARDGGVDVGDALARLDAAIAAAPGGTTSAPALASPQETVQPLPAGQRWMQVASRQTLDEAVVVAREHQARFPNVSVYRTRNGWLAIVVGVVRSADAASMIESYASRGWIPSDSVSTRGESFVAKIWPSDPPATSAKTPPQIAAAPSVVQDEAPANVVGQPPAIEQTAQEAFSLGTRFIAAGEYDALEAARPTAARLGDLPIIRTARDTYVIVVAHGPETKLAALYDRMRQAGQLPDGAKIVDGYDFLRRVFPDKK